MKIHAKHILVDNRSKALKIIENLKEGANFESQAKKHSKCPSGDSGGDLGWFGKGKMVKLFEQAAFKLNKGEVSEPVRTQFGWHIIKVIDKEN